MAGGHGDLSKQALLDDEELDRSVIISDPSMPGMPIIYVSEEFEAQTGYPPAEVLGRTCRFMQGPETDPKAVQAIRRAVETKNSITIDVLNYRKDGSPFWNRLRIRPICDDNGTLLYYIGTQNPIGADAVRPNPFEADVD
jgi:PAS domain S-box-containing protein